VRIGVVSTSYPRAPGDPAGAFVAGLARHAAGRGHEVEVVAAGPGQDRDGEIAIHRVCAGASLFYDEGAPDRIERRPGALAVAPAFVVALAAQVLRRSRRWDRIVAHWLLPSALVAARLKPTLAVAHSGDVHLAVRLGLADAVAAGLGPRTRVAFVAEHLRQRLVAAVRRRRLRDRLVGQSFVCPMGVEAPPARDRAGARRRLGLAEAGPVVAFLGRLVPIKGVEVLIRAMPDGASLVVAGDGPLRGALAARGVRLLGEVRGDEKADLFAAADVLVLPSIEIGGRTEGAPTVLVEAMAAGVPVVASDVPGAREVCGDAALYALLGDAAGLRAAIAAAIVAPAERLARGRLRAAAFSWDVIGGRLLEELGKPDR